MNGLIVVGYILSKQLAFMIFAAVYFVGAFCRLFIDPVTPLENGNGEAIESAAV